MPTRRRTNRITSCRRGLAATELAVCLPTLVFTFLAALQAADMIFLKQTLHVASYEAARIAIRRNGTSNQALSSGEEVLTKRDVKECTVTFVPRDISSAHRGDVVSVTVKALTDANTVLPNWFSSADMAVTTRMVKE